MAFTFEALPIGRGDAFLLCDNDNIFLFDGGQYAKQTTRFLQEKGIRRINVIICSHNDSDHINGVIGVLESGIQVGELWLPASWCDFLATIAHKKPWPIVILEENKDNNSMIKEWSEQNKINIEVEKCDNVRHSNEALNYDFTIENLVKNICEFDCNNWPLSLRCTNAASIWYPTVLNMMLAGQRIVDVVEKAWNKGCCIRLFEYKSQLTSCKSVMNTNFAPLNCQETSSIKRYKTAIFALYLTQINRNSLVFQYTKNKDDGSSVLFLADSDLSFMSSQFSLKIPTIITAPHHGSSDNEYAYDVIHGDLLTWVRSDSRNRKRPCKKYIKQQTRYCTLCNNMSSPKQAVALEWSSGKWLANNRTKRCTCN